MSKNNLQEYTESEFLSFVRKICEADFATEAENDSAIYEFARITEHPEGWNLIFHPKNGADNSPEGVVKTIKEWRAANNKSGFKGA
ncbi:bacteriocin immunity protein [Kosakonia sp. MUSA4]|uniref:bacteriocin immunity protein n=1 Tax=Kosakonia sp. MUSA4 TaxID=2067958 RepID=UPI00159B39B1|nr:bacteriocin immunity protein [Kosakonia sp. MUSA4]QJT78666.1 bacteriocin immunity protein [Kosakonia sp. MUSA4]